MSNSQIRVRQLCRIGVMAALYVPLALYVAVRIGNVQISFGSLPVVIAALLWGPGESFMVAVIGELFKQLLSYGLTATTVLYLIPPALRGVVIGLAALWLWKVRGERLDERRWICYAVCMLAAMVTTSGNTLVILVDSIIYGYYSPLVVFGDAMWRFAVGLINSIVMSTAAMPLVRQLRRQGRGNNYAGSRGN